MRDRAIESALRDVSVTARGAIRFAREASANKGPFTGLYATLNGVSWEQRVAMAMGAATSLGRAISTAEKRVDLGTMTPARLATFVSDRIRATVRTPLKRIAETEAYASAKEALLNTFAAQGIAAVKWETTSARPCKRCIALRDTDYYGLGAGVYPLGRLPRPPHPHCKCRLTPVRIEASRALNAKLRDVAPNLPGDTPRDDAKRTRDELRTLLRETPTLREEKSISKAAASRPEPEAAAPAASTLAPDVIYKNIRSLETVDWAREAVKSSMAGTSGKQLPEIRVVREKARQMFADALKQLGGARVRLRTSSFDDPAPDNDGAHAVYDFMSQVMRVGPDTTQHLDRWLAGARDGQSWRAVQTVVHEMHHAASGYGEWVNQNFRTFAKYGANVHEASRRLEESMVEHLSRRATVAMSGTDAKVAAHLEAVGSYPSEVPIARMIERRLGGDRLMALYQTGNVPDRIAAATNDLTEIFEDIVAPLSTRDRDEALGVWYKLNDAAKIDAAMKGKLLWALDTATSTDEIIERLADYGFLT